MPQNIKQHIKQQFEEVRRKRQERIAKAVGWEKKLLLGIAECKDIDWHIDLIKQTLQALATEMMEGVGIKDGKCCERCFITEELDIPVCANPIECLCHNKEIRKVFKAVVKKWGLV